MNKPLSQFFEETFFCKRCPVCLKNAFRIAQIKVLANIQLHLSQTGLYDYEKKVKSAYPVIIEMKWYHVQDIYYHAGKYTGKVRCWVLFEENQMNPNPS